MEYLFIKNNVMLQKYSYHKISFTFTNGNKYNDKLKFTKERN
jgi:hypothetical protein